MLIKIINSIIVSVDEDFNIFHDGEIIIKDNIIIYVGDKISSDDEKKLINNLSYDKIIDSNKNIIMPGFINTHSHLPMTLFRGMADNLNFYDWFNKAIKPLEDNLLPEKIFEGASIGIKEMLQNGITTVFDLYFDYSKTIKAAEELGIRLGVGFGALSGKEKISQDYLQSEYLKITSHKNIIPFTYAHAPYSVDENQFYEILKFARLNNLVFCTHASETLYEVGEADKKYGKTPIGLLESYGAFDVPCVLAHCVHVDKEDIEILKNYNVSVSTNPSANLKLGSGIAPLYALKKAGVNIAIGTDGAAGNNSLDMFKETYLSGVLQAGVLNDASLMKTKDLLKMATVNGALAFGINNLGVLKKGYLADLIMLDSHAPNMQPLNDVVSNIVYSANPSNVLLTMVDGKIVYEKK